MAFLRIKKIKGIEYAYLVKNRWTKKGARQKVSKYIGKLIRPEITSVLSFENYIEIDIARFVEEEDPGSIIDSLIEFELLRHGFRKDSHFLAKGDLEYKNHRLTKSKRNVVLLINDGFMCTYTIKELLKFDYLGDETDTATELANVFVNCGIQVPQDLFILFFRKIYHENRPTKIQ
jgi:hypothetical protein